MAQNINDSAYLFVSGALKIIPALLAGTRPATIGRSFLKKLLSRISIPRWTGGFVSRVLLRMICCQCRPRDRQQREGNEALAS